MKKLIKGLILLPMWPLIWHAESNEDCGCGSRGCLERARRMRAWYER